MANNKHLQHVKSSVLDKAPTADNILYGELAVNYAQGGETIYLRNSEDEIVGITDTSKYYDAIATDLSTHIEDTSNPHSVTKAQINLGNVDNTADEDKPISTAQQTALDGKLSAEDIVTNGTFTPTTDYVSTKALAANVGLTLYELLQEAAGGTIGDITDLEQRVASLEEEVEGIVTYEEAIQAEEDCLFCDIIDGIEEYFPLSKLSETSCVQTATSDRDPYSCGD